MLVHIVIELQELARPIVMYGPKVYFFCGFPKKEMFTQISVCLFSTCHQTLLTFGFRDSLVVKSR